MPNTPKGLTYPSNASPVAVPADIQELATDVDNIIVPISGGTYSGAVAFLQNPSVPTPTSALHAVNKTYADSINADVTALENELGANPSGTFSTVVQRLDTYTDGFGKIGNLLTDNQASGTDTLGDTTGFTSASGATLARNTGWSKQGTGALLVTASSAALHDVTIERFDIVPGQTYTFLASVLRGTGARTMRLTVEWYTSAYGYISQSVGATLNPGSAVDSSVTVTAPATAAIARLKATTLDTGSAGDNFWIDALSWHKGASGQWAMPGQPIVGQSPIASNGAVHLSGTGTPEGVVTAAPGSTWLQTDASNDVKGWIRWNKTGSGSTGWVAGPEADTGWRDRSADIISANGWTGGTIQLRRVGSTVFLDASGLTRASGGAGTVLSLAAGFRPYATRFFAAFSGNTMYVTAAGTFQYAAAGTTSYGSCAYATSDTWPSSLPGSAA